MAGVRLVTDIQPYTTLLPFHFIRPIWDRPNLNEVQHSETSIPIIDLQNLNGPNRDSIIKLIADACQNHGFFQVKNHGIPESLNQKFLQVSKEFFRLPESERLKYYSDDHSKTIRLSTSSNVKKEKFYSWRDYLRLHCHPLEQFVHEWPSNPSSFRGVAAEYCTSIRGLVLRLLEAISESLGLKEDCIGKALGNHGQHMAINYYPPCPEPDLTYGLPGHTDPNALTLLLQDQVAGLQVLRNGKWLALNPIPNHFVVNIGDQIQVLSNGRYKSVLHRAVVNRSVERMSIATFYCPSPEAIIGPTQELVDDEHPALYRNFTYSEYFEKFWEGDLQTNGCLAYFKVP